MVTSNKKLCGLCAGWLVLVAASPKFGVRGVRGGVVGVRVVQECPVCMLKVNRTMTLSEFQEYTAIMRVLGQAVDLPY